CSGAKSILDIGRTLEYLETGGVPVVGYQTDEMPAFYTRESGFRLPMRVDTPEEAASLFRIARALSYPGGMVVANPVPPEDAMDSETIDRAIANALEDAEREGITGKEISPFLLARIAAETEGDSLRSNIALVRNNARLAADIALAYAKG
ncbi:MAG TPA: pseudouridine-5'-phosphate glycosidase, partial [Bacillota bacterium]|nr:pseudouridine-5'-phosphate glycosidase [Bacillota bacterium]